MEHGAIKQLGRQSAASYAHEAHSRNHKEAALLQVDAAGLLRELLEKQAEWAPKVAAKHGVLAVLALIAGGGAEDGRHVAGGANSAAGQANRAALSLLTALQGLLQHALESQEASAGTPRSADGDGHGESERLHAAAAESLLALAERGEREQSGAPTVLWGCLQRLPACSAAAAAVLRRADSLQRASALLMALAAPARAKAGAFALGWRADCVLCALRMLLAATVGAGARAEGRSEGGSCAALPPAAVEAALSMLSALKPSRIPEVQDLVAQLLLGGGGGAAPIAIAAVGDCLSERWNWAHPCLFKAVPRRMLPESGGDELTPLLTGALGLLLSAPVLGDPLAAASLRRAAVALVCSLCSAQHTRVAACVDVMCRDDVLLATLGRFIEQPASTTEVVTGAARCLQDACLESPELAPALVAQAGGVSSLLKAIRGSGPRQEQEALSVQAALLCVLRCKAARLTAAELGVGAVLAEALLFRDEAAEQERVASLHALVECVAAESALFVAGGGLACAAPMLRTASVAARRASAAALAWAATMLDENLAPNSAFDAMLSAPLNKFEALASPQAKLVPEDAIRASFRRGQSREVEAAAAAAASALGSRSSHMASGRIGRRKRMGTMAQGAADEQLKLDEVALETARKQEAFRERLCLMGCFVPRSVLQVMLAQ